MNIFFGRDIIDDLSNVESYLLHIGKISLHWRDYFGKIKDKTKIKEIVGFKVEVKN
jgi:hypothetical protein